jgi:hypothetical protein
MNTKLQPKPKIDSHQDSTIQNQVDLTVKSTFNNNTRQGQGQDFTEKLVPYNEFKKLKDLLDRKINQLKQCQEILSNYKSSVDELERNLNASSAYYEKVVEIEKSIRQKENEKLSHLNTSPIQTLQGQGQGNQVGKGKEEFTSSKSQDVIKNKLDFNGLNQALFIKKIEDLESAFKESTNNFSILLKKYCVMHEDYTALKEENKVNLDKIKQLTHKLKKKNDELNDLKYDLDRKDKLIVRFREIDYCMLETMIKSCLMNTKKSANDVTNNKDYPTSSIATHQNMSPSKGVDGSTYISTEPIPSLFKFFTNNKKPTATGNLNLAQSTQNLNKQ